MLRYVCTEEMCSCRDVFFAARGKIVDDCHFVSGTEIAGGHMRTDKACTACYKDSHGVSISELQRMLQRTYPILDGGCLGKLPPLEPQFLLLKLKKAGTQSGN